jgi:hypothetical protein
MNQHLPASTARIQHSCHIVFSKLFTQSTSHTSAAPVMESLYAHILCKGWYRDSGTYEATCVKTNDIKPMIINGVVEGEDQWDEI